MKFRFTAAALALSLCSPFTASADVPVNGIGGLAVSPDGSTVLAAGDSRVVYVLDAATMQVKNRVYSGTTTVWMKYRQDGKVVFSRDTSGKVHAIDTTTYKSIWSVDRTEAIDYAFAANTLAFAVRSGREYVARIIDANTFQTKAEYKLGERYYPAGLGLSIDGLKMVVVSRSEKRANEERKRPPSDMRGLPRYIFQQEHDQYGSRITQIDLISNQVTTTESWWRTSSVRAMHVSLAETYVLGYTSDNARIAPDGTVTIIDAGARSQYAAGMTPAMDTILTGSMRSITVKKVGADAAQVYKLSNLPGWPEYVVRFTTGPDGKIYASTNAYRVIVLDLNAGKVKGYPVY